MSYEYDRYLEQHKANVIKGFNFLRENFPDLTYFDNVEHQVCFGHDASKSDSAEYRAYDAYFYGGNRSYKVVQDFNKAWLRHIHRNPHHWQHWVLINDDPDEGEIALEMPLKYIIEMICDWWSFSWSQCKPFEIFDWYDEHKDYMKLHPKTRKQVEDILAKIKAKLEEGSDENNR